MEKPVEFTSVPGSVELLEATGDDSTVVNSATVSHQYTGEIEPKTKHDRLLEGMPMEGHWGCMRHIVASFRITCPIIVARHIVRSSGMAFNELSGRYSEIEPLFYLPEELHTDVKRKELGNEPTPLDSFENNEALFSMKDVCVTAWTSYQHSLKLKVRKEQARFILPINVFTSFWMTGDLRHWLHFLNLRDEGHTQHETRFIAKLIYEELWRKYPKTIEYWEKYGRGPINQYGTIQSA